MHFQFPTIKSFILSFKFVEYPPKNFLMNRGKARSISYHPQIGLKKKKDREIYSSKQKAHIQILIPLLFLFLWITCIIFRFGSIYSCVPEPFFWEKNQWDWGENGRESWPTLSKPSPLTFSLVYSNLTVSSFTTKSRDFLYSHSKLSRSNWIKGCTATHKRLLYRATECLLY